MDGFEFSGSGRLLRVDKFVSKAGKNIYTMALEVSGQYPQLVPIKVFGRLADQIDTWSEGDTLQVSGRLGGRDWNGKVFGDIVAQTVEVVSSQKQSNGNRTQGTNTGWGSEGSAKAASGGGWHGQSPNQDDDDVPF
jgi:single-stranded DNA-binding protein